MKKSIRMLFIFFAMVVLVMENITFGENGIVTQDDLFYKYPVYLENKDIDDFMKNCCEYCDEAENTISNKDEIFASYFESLNSGENYIIKNFLASLGLDDSNYRDYENDIAEELIYEYFCIDEDMILKKSGEMLDGLKGLENYSIEMTPEIYVYLKEHMKTNVGKRAVDYMDDYSELLGIFTKLCANGYEIQKSYMILAYYNDIEVQILDELIVSLDCNSDLYRILVKKRNDIEGNPLKYLIKNKIDEKILGKIVDVAKHLDEDAVGTSNYIIAKKLYAIAEMIYTKYNPSVKDIMLVYLTDQYTTQVDSMVMKLRMQIINGHSDEKKIDKYRQVYGFFVACLKIRMEKCAAALKNNNASLKSKLEVYSEYLGEDYNYDCYIKSCMKNLQDDINEGKIDIAAEYKLTCDKPVLLFNDVMKKDEESETLTVTIKNEGNREVTLKKPRSHYFITSLNGEKTIKQGESVKIDITVDKKDIPGNYNEVIDFRIRESSVTYAEINCGYVVKRTGEEELIDVNYGQILIIDKDGANLVHGEIEEVDLQNNKYLFNMYDNEKEYTLEKISGCKINLNGGTIYIKSNIYIGEIDFNIYKSYEMGDYRNKYGHIFIEDDKDLSVDKIKFTETAFGREQYIVGGTVRFLEDEKGVEEKSYLGIVSIGSNIIFEKGVTDFDISDNCCSDYIWVNGNASNCTFNGSNIVICGDCNDIKFEMIYVSYLNNLNIKGKYTGELNLFCNKLCHAEFYGDVDVKKISIRNAEVYMYGDFAYSGWFSMNGDKSYLCVYGDTYANGITYRDDESGYNIMAGIIEFKGDVISSGIKEGTSWGWPFLAYPINTKDYDDLKIILSGDDKQKLQGRDLCFGNLEIKNNKIYTDTGFMIYNLNSDWQYDGNLEIFIRNGNGHKISVNGDCKIDPMCASSTGHRYAFGGGKIEKLKYDVKGTCVLYECDLLENSYIKAVNVECESDQKTIFGMIDCHNMVCKNYKVDGYAVLNIEGNLCDISYINSILWTSGTIKLGGDFIIGKNSNRAYYYKFMTGENLRFIFNGTNRQRIRCEKSIDGINIALFYPQNSDIEFETYVTVGRLGCEWNIGNNNLLMTLKDGNGYDININGDYTGDLSLKNTNINVTGDIKKYYYINVTSGEKNYYNSSLNLLSGAKAYMQGPISDGSISVYDDGYIEFYENCSCYFSLYDFSQVIFRKNFEGSIYTPNGRYLTPSRETNPIIKVYGDFAPMISQNSSDRNLRGDCYVYGNLDIRNNNDVIIDNLHLLNEEIQNISAKSLKINNLETKGEITISRNSYISSFKNLESDLVVREANCSIHIDEWNNHSLVLSDTVYESYPMIINYPKNYIEIIEKKELGEELRYTHIYKMVGPLVPESSIKSGSTVEKGMEVVLSSSKGAVIYYTLDGSEPTSESAIYNSPIVILDDIHIRAMASLEGFEDSEIADLDYYVKKYNVNNVGDSKYCNIESKTYKEGEQVIIKLMNLEGIELSEKPIRVKCVNSVVDIEVLGDDNEYSFIMPQDDVNIYFDYEYISYDIEYENIPENTLNVNPKSYTILDDIVLNNPENDGYIFIGWTYDGIEEPVYEINISKGTTGDKKYIAHWKEKEGHNIVIEVLNDGIGGNVSVNVEKARLGEEISLVIDTYEYYSIKKIYIQSPDAIELSDGYTFIMPDEDVKIIVEFEVDINGILDQKIDQEDDDKQKDNDEYLSDEYDDKNIIDMGEKKEKNIPEINEISRKDNTDKKLKEGDIVNDKNYIYKVIKTSSSSKNNMGELSIIGLKKKSLQKIKIAKTVTINDIKYKVTKIENKAFTRNKKIKKVYIGKNITKIGSRAFAGCKNLRKVFIKSLKIKKIGNKAFYRKDGKKIVISVPKSKKKRYKKLIKSAKTNKYKIR